MSWASGRSRLPVRNTHYHNNRDSLTLSSPETASNNNNLTSISSPLLLSSSSPPKLPKGIRKLKLIPISPSSTASISPKKLPLQQANLNLVQRNIPHRQVTFLIEDKNSNFNSKSKVQADTDTLQVVQVQQVKASVDLNTSSRSPYECLLSPQEELNRIRERKALLRQQFFNDTTTSTAISFPESNMPVTKETASSAAHKASFTSTPTGIPKLYSVRNRSPQPPIPCPTFNADGPSSSASPRQGQSLNSNLNVTLPGKAGSTPTGPAKPRRSYNVPNVTTTTLSSSRIPQGNRNSPVVASPSTTNINKQGQRMTPSNKSPAGTTTTLKKPEPTTPFYMLGLRQTGSGSVQERTKYWQSRITVPAPISNSSFVRVGVGYNKDGNKDNETSISSNKNRSRSRPSPKYYVQGNRSSELRMRKNSPSPTPPPHVTDHEFLDDEISDQPGLLLGTEGHQHTESFKQTGSTLGLGCSSSTSVSLSSSVSSMDKDKSPSPSPRGSRSSVSSSVPSCRDMEDSADEKTIAVSKYKGFDVKSILPELASLHTELLILKETIEYQEQVSEEKDNQIQELKAENLQLRNVIQKVNQRLEEMECLGTTNNGYSHSLSHNHEYGHGENTDFKET